MILFKTVDQYDQNTGEKIKPIRVASYRICDWTGNKIVDENPNNYVINFNNNDPCFGDGLDEGWVFKLPEPFSYAHNDLFGQREYIYSLTEGFKEPLMDILKVFNEEKGLEELCGFDTLLRWSRAKMLKRVIEEGRYNIQDFIQDLRDYGE